MNILLFPLGASILALAYAAYGARDSVRLPLASDYAASPADKIMLIAAAVSAVAIYFLIGHGVAGAFVVGVVASLLATRIGALGIRRDVAGFVMVGLALGSLTGLWWVAPGTGPLVGLAFGAALVSLFESLAGTSGLTGDLFSTYLVSAISVMLLTSFLLPQFAGLEAVPLLIGVVGIVASIIGSFVMHMRQTITGALYQGLAVAASVATVAFWFLCTRLPLIANLGPKAGVRIFASLIIGLAVTGLVMAISEFYKSKKSHPARALESVALPVVVVVGALYGTYALAGIYGVGLSVMSMASLAGLMVVVDWAVAKGYAIVSAGLASLVLFAAYTETLSNLGRSVFFLLSDVRVLIGLFVGGMMIYLFVSMVMQMASSDSHTEIILPALVAFALPVAIGFLLGAEALGGVLVGATITGVFVSISLARDRDTAALSSVMKFAGLIALVIARFI